MIKIYSDDNVYISYNIGGCKFGFSMCRLMYAQFATGYIDYLCFHIFFFFSSEVVYFSHTQIIFSYTHFERQTATKSRNVTPENTTRKQCRSFERASLDFPRGLSKLSYDASAP